MLLCGEVRIKEPSIPQESHDDFRMLDEVGLLSGGLNAHM